MASSLPFCMASTRRLANGVRRAAAQPGTRCLPTDRPGDEVNGQGAGWQFVVEGATGSP